MVKSLDNMIEKNFDLILKFLLFMLDVNCSQHDKMIYVKFT